MTDRVFNFAAGPAVLPAPVLEEAQRDLIALPDTGMSVLEMSHRSKKIEGIMEAAESDIRQLAGIPDNYRVLFLQGGASLQFSMAPMNLLGDHDHAGHVVTGHFAKLALEEARAVGEIKVAATTEPEGFVRIPSQDELGIGPWGGLSPPHHQQHHLWHGMAG